MKPLLIGVALSLALAPVVRAEQTFTSGPAQVALVELFTSEGCSSCPPAEKWLSDLRQAPGLWTAFVPVAFHVNYWDHLGWKDRLAAEAYTDREHAYAAAWAAPSVYTPCFVRNGSEWRPRSGAQRELVAPGSMAAGELTLTWQDDHTCLVRYTPAAGTRSTTRYEVAVALLGGGLESNVRAGENRGQKLRHEFVVLRLVQANLSSSDSRALTATLSVPARTDLPAARHALAAWVTARGDTAVVQATGGWLDGGVNSEARKP